MEQALFNRRGQTVGTDDGAERIPAMAVTPSFFRLLRVPAHRDPVFTDEDGEVGADQKVILSHQLWQRLGAVVLGVVALLACVVPAARATRIDPSLALGTE